MQELEGGMIRKTVSAAAQQTPRSVQKKGERQQSRDSPTAPGADDGEAAVPLQPCRERSGRVAPVSLRAGRRYWEERARSKWV